jgi:hypothetical protein
LLEMAILVSRNVGYYEDMLAHSADPQMRDAAIVGARACLIGLGRVEEAKKLSRRFRPELRRLLRVTDPANIATPAVPPPR